MAITPHSVKEDRCDRVSPGLYTAFVVNKQNNNRDYEYKETIPMWPACKYQVRDEQININILGA